MNIYAGFRSGLKIGLVSSVCALALVGAAIAETRSFDVPSGDLKAGLDAYIRQSGTQLIYRVDDVKGKQTKGVQGALSPEDALGQILAGSGFAITRDQSGAIVVAKAPQSARAAAESAAAAVDAAADADDTEEVVIVGIRRSLQKSKDVKKAADANIDVVTAEDVGKFPDINVAESLARLPGLAVDRSSGEGEKLSILGIDSRLNLISLNNHPMATADYGTSTEGAGRSFNYSLLAPELIGQAEVYKSYEARLDEGSVGGQVIIHTRKPLDLPKNTLTASVGYSENQRTKNGDGKGSILYSWKNDNKTFGVLASASYNNYTIGGTSIAVFDYSTGCRFANYDFWTRTPPVTDPYGGCGNNAFTDPSKLPAISNGGPALTPSTVIPGSINQGSFIQDRKRTTYSVGAQWRPTEDLEFGFEALVIKGDYSSFSRSMQADVGVEWNGGPEYGTLMTSGNRVIGGDANAIVVRQDLYYKKSELTNETYDLNAKWTPGDWVIKANLGTSKATGGVEPEYYLDFKGMVGAEWRIENQQTYIKYDQPLDTPNLLRSGTGNTGFISTIPFEDKIDYAGIDFKKQISFGIFDEILFGYKRSEHTNSKTHIENQFNTGPTGVYLDQLDTFQTPTSWAEGLGGSGDILSYRTATLESFLAYANAQTNPKDRNFNWNNFFGSELLDAAYLQGNFEYEKWRGNVGVRFAKSENEQTFLTEDGTIPFVDNADYLGYEPGKGIQTIKTDHNHVLPAINLVYEPIDDVLLRFNAAKVIARPSFEQMSAAIKIDYQTRRASGGNAYLEPYEATNYGASAEWYFNPTSYVSFDVFYRDIGSYIVSKTSLQTFRTSAAALAANPSLPATQVYELSAPFNANDAKISGMILSLQTDLWYGFGLVTNLTYADDDVSTLKNALNPNPSKMYMPYLSKYLFNFAPYYEKGPWQARLAYSYRTKYVTVVGVDRVNNYNWTPERNQLDFSGSYQVNDHISLYLTASNLLDELQVPYRDDPNNPLSWTKNGKVVTFSVNYKM